MPIGPSNGVRRHYLSGSLPAPDPKDVAAVIWFLPLFEQARAGCGGAQSSPFGIWQEDSHGQARVEYGPDALAFVRLLEERGWVEPGYRPGTAALALRHWQNPKLIAEADSATLRALLSDIVRTERVCEGHLLEAFERGYLTTILRRLRSLRDRPGDERR